jgi:putative transposase
VKCVKYKRKAPCSQQTVYLLKSKIRDISKTFCVEVLNVECDLDNFHMLFTSKPTLDIPKHINTIKTIYSREIIKKFSE